jgi:hypothetical protein
MTHVRKQFMQEIKLEQARLEIIKAQKQMDREVAIAKLREDRERRRA